MYLCLETPGARCAVGDDTCYPPPPPDVSHSPPDPLDKTGLWNEDDIGTPTTLEESSQPPILMTGPEKGLLGVLPSPQDDDKQGGTDLTEDMCKDDGVETSGKQGRGLETVQGGPDAKGGPLGAVKRDKCVYRRGGVCNTHGEGAIRKWKPTRTVVVGDDGMETIKKGKKMFWVCDLNNAVFLQDNPCEETDE